MADNLVIVESPAKADTIRKFLGDGFTVKSSFGHIRDLQDNKLGVDIANGFRPEYVIPAGKKRVVSELKKLAAGAKTVWLASDEDREGEAISWHLYDVLGLKPEATRRIVFHEITKDAILKAVENPRSIDMNMVDAQQARRVLDRLVGFELSPILWRKIQPKLSAGRVQSVALRLVVDREKEIIAFQNTPFYRIEALFHPTGSDVKVKAVLDKHMGSLQEARQFLEDSIGAAYRIASVEKKEGVRVPAAPFTTSTLQQEASRKLRFPVSTTMRIAQGLYERGLITYMRTDSTNLSSLAINTAKRFICDNFGAEYSTVRQYRTRSKGAQEAHEAIRPTYIDNVSIEGSAQEQKLYKLIWQRTVASQMADMKVLGTTIAIASDRRAERFIAQAQEILFDGFYRLYAEGRDDEETPDWLGQVLPAMNEGDILVENGISALCKYTAAPPRYSEATLVKKLEELGIGRPSTYSSIISTLTTGRGYIAKGDKEGRSIPVENLTLKGRTITPSSKTEIVGAEKGKLLPQEIGIIVTDYLVDHFADILDYDFTANVEKDFDEIAEGEKPWNKVIADFYSPFHRKVEESMEDKQYNRVSRVIGTDPETGETLTAKYGQFGAYVQKGEGESRQFASLSKGQLIENITLEEALKLFQLPRTVGQIDGVDVIVTKGRFGPYIKFGDRNISLPRSTDPMKADLETCRKVIETDAGKTAQNAVLATFGDIEVVNGRYGPYLRSGGNNYKIPRGTDPATLTEEACQAIIAGGEPTASKPHRRFAYRKKKS